MGAEMLVRRGLRPGWKKQSGGVIFLRFGWQVSPLCSHCWRFSWPFAVTPPLTRAQLLLNSIATSSATLSAATAYTIQLSRLSSAPVALNSLLVLAFSNDYLSLLPALPLCSSVLLPPSRTTSAVSRTAVGLAPLLA
jgi:hypothetical protein